MMPGQSSKKIAGVRRSGPPSKDVFSSPAPAPRGEPLREEDDFPAAPDEDDEQFSTPRGASSKSSVFHSAASAIPSSDLLLAASSDLAEPKKPSPHITLGFSLGRLPSPMDQPARKVSYVDNNLVKQRTVSGSSTHAPTPVEGGSDEFDPVDGTPEPSTGRLSPPSQDSSTTSHRAAALGPPPGLSPTPSHQQSAPVLPRTIGSIGEHSLWQEQVSWSDQTPTGSDSTSTTGPATGVRHTGFPGPLSTPSVPGPSRLSASMSAGDSVRNSSTAPPLQRNDSAGVRLFRVGSDVGSEGSWRAGSYPAGGAPPGLVHTLSEPRPRSSMSSSETTPPASSVAGRRDRTFRETPTERAARLAAAAARGHGLPGALGDSVLRTGSAGATRQGSGAAHSSSGKLPYYPHSAPYGCGFAVEDDPSPTYGRGVRAASASAAPCYRTVSREGSSSGGTDVLYHDRSTGAYYRTTSHESAAGGTRRAPTTGAENSARERSVSFSTDVTGDHGPNRSALPPIVGPRGASVPYPSRGGSVPLQGPQFVRSSSDPKHQQHRAPYRLVSSAAHGNSAAHTSSVGHASASSASNDKTPRNVSSSASTSATSSGAAPYLSRPHPYQVKNTFLDLPRETSYDIEYEYRARTAPVHGSSPMVRDYTEVSSTSLVVFFILGGKRGSLLLWSVGTKY